MRQSCLITKEKHIPKRGGGIFHCPVPSHSRRLSPLQVFGSADFLLWGLPSAKTVINRFMPRSPIPFSEGHGGAENPDSASRGKEKTHHKGVFSFYLVAEMGFEPHDLRVMSPTSYQTAPLRDMMVPEAGVEPVRDKISRDFKSRASAYSAIPANRRNFQIAL